MRRLLQTGFLYSMLLVLLVACGGGGGGSSSGGTSTVSVSLTDDSGCAYQKVVVTISKVSFHMSATASESDGGWHDIVPAGSPIQVDLLTLQNGTLMDLGLTALPAGDYTQVRLFVDPNTASDPMKNFVTVAGVDHALTVPSGAQTGIKVIKPFTAPDGQTTEIIIDFDACNSVVKAGSSGKYILKPRILPILKSETGTITGVVETANLSASSQAVALAEVKDSDGNYHVLRQTAINLADGKFTLYPLLNSSLIATVFPDDPAGAYDVVIVSGDTATVVTTGVSVAAGASVAISDAAHKTPLPASAAAETVDVTIDPTGADARILQNVHGNAYEIRRMPVDIADGTASFSLAIDKPRYGAFSALPVLYATDAPAVSLSVDTPNLFSLYNIAAKAVAAVNGSTQTVLFTGADKLTPASGTAGTVTGTILNSGGTGTYVVSVMRDGAFNINSGSFTITGFGTFSIGDVAPGTYSVSIVSGASTVSPSSLPVTITNGGTGGGGTGNFTVSP